MTARWTDPTPTRTVGLGAGLIVIGLLWLIALLAWAARDAGATQCEYTYTGCTTTTYPTTTVGTTTTTEPEGDPEPTTTTAATTTVPATTTTAGTNCGLCGGQSSTPTTVPVTTTVAATTTTAAPTTTVAPPTSEGTSGQEPEVIPPVVETPAAVDDTLPVTGAETWWLALFGVCLVALGGLAVAWKRTA